MAIRRLLTLAAMLGVLPCAARAQTVRGVVTDQSQRPIEGVVLFLVDSASRSVARTLSDQQGQFRIATSASGTYRLRTQRIGFRPVVSDPIELRPGGEVTQRIVVTSVPTALDTIRVVDRNACRAFSDSGAGTFAVWEQIRAALVATDLTTTFRNIAATTVVYERVLDPRGGRDANRVLQQKSSVSTGYVNRPWRTISPDSLRRVGYVVADRDQAVIYYAPGIDALLSGAFVEDHCFRLASDNKRPELIGLTFEPTPDRRRVAEIKGTLWVDRKSSELRRLDFDYANLPFEQAEQAGGALQFVRMRDGTWAISQWSIRMPAFTSVIRPGHGAERQLAEIQVAGGELALARRGLDTLWAKPSVVLNGTLRDSLSGATIAGAQVSLAGTDLFAATDDRGRFALSGILPGVYEAVIRTPSLDSMNASHRVPFEFLNPADRVEWRVPNAQQLANAICGGTNARDASGIIVGRARLRGDSGAIRNLSVVAHWPSGDSTAREMRAPGATDGSFRICNVPVNVAVTLRAKADSAETTEATSVTLPAASRMKRIELSLERASALAARGSTFVGVVVSDSTHAPLGAAEVAFPDLAKNAFTSASGEFKINGIPAGEHRVTVRKIGYGAADTRLSFDGRATIERRVVLGRAVTLETVVVEARASDKMRATFDENRRLGLGHFMTLDQITKYDGMDMSTVLQQIPTTGLADGRGHIWVTSRRRPIPVCPPTTPTVYNQCLEMHGFYMPEYNERMQGMPVECWAHVYVDGVLQNGAKKPTEPFDMKQIPADHVEAIEFYASSAETPLQYSRAGADCGVLVIWTRRYGANARP